MWKDSRGYNCRGSVHGVSWGIGGNVMAKTCSGALAISLSGTVSQGRKNSGFANTQKFISRYGVCDTPGVGGKTKSLSRGYASEQLVALLAMSVVLRAAAV